MIIVKTLVLCVLWVLHANELSNIYIHTLKMKTHRSNTVADLI